MCSVQQKRKIVREISWRCFQKSVIAKIPPFPILTGCWICRKKRRTCDLWQSTKECVNYRIFNSEFWEWICNFGGEWSLQSCSHLYFIVCGQIESIGLVGRHTFNGLIPLPPRLMIKLATRNSTSGTKVPRGKTVPLQAALSHTCYLPRKETYLTLFLHGHV